MWMFFRCTLICSGVFHVTFPGTTATGQNPLPLKHAATLKRHPQDGAATWTLGFRFNEPQLVQHSVPGAGKRWIAYLVYQVYNPTPMPRVFVPDFQLVDWKEKKTYVDAIVSNMTPTILKREKLDGLLNSVKITNKPIDPSKLKRPVFVNGFAVWNVGPLKSESMTIYVRGLSNGYAVAKGSPRLKMLKLEFKRKGKRLKFVSANWVYRNRKIKFSINERRNTNVEKGKFLKLLSSLRMKGEFFADDAIDIAAPYTRVLLSLTPKDIDKFDIYRIFALSRGLLNHREQRDLGVMHFGTIAHPEIKLAWAAMLFDAKAASPEIVAFLRAAMISKDQRKQLAEMIGPGFREFRIRLEKYKSKK